MNKVCCAFLTLTVIAPHCGFAQIDDGCPREEIRAHVLAQFDAYGPRSIVHEYFGFIYNTRDVLGSAVIRSRSCRRGSNCIINVAEAAKLIPSGAKILGEWHTHPHRHGSHRLSELDVTGAHSNRHLRCYAAFFSAPSGEIYVWDPKGSSVQAAMRSRVLIGNYRQPLLAEARDSRGPAGG